MCCSTHLDVVYACKYKRRSRADKMDQRGNTPAAKQDVLGSIPVIPKQKERAWGLECYPLTYTYVR